MGQDAVAGALYTDPTGLLKNPSSLVPQVLWCCAAGNQHVGEGRAQAGGAVRRGVARRLGPDDQVLVEVDRVLDLSWLPEEVADGHGADDGRRGSTPRSRCA